jgi:DNA-binding CsgD family transcriptional regulator
MELVGRTAQLRALAEQLGRARDGRLGLVVVHGERGTGKTTLCRAFLAEPGTEHVLMASADQAEATVAFGIIVQFMASAGEQLPRLATARATATATAATAAAGAAAGGSADPTSAPSRVAEVGLAVLRLIQRLLAGDQTVVLLVDDVHWADDFSQQALAFALRRLRNERVLCVLAMAGAPSELSDGLRHLVTALASTVRLTGLDPDELRALAQGMSVPPLSHWAAARLHALTGGNILHARALLEELPAQALDNDADPLPATSALTQDVQGRLAACADDVQRIVAAAAVLGPSCRLADAAGIAMVDDPALALEGAVAAALLTEKTTAVDRTVAFTEPLVRSAVYHGLGPAQRSELHLCAASLIDDPRARLWHRVVAAVVPDEGLAMEVEHAARQLAEGGRWRPAAEHLLAAARLSPHRTAREQRFTDALDYLLWGGELAYAASLLADLDNLLDDARGGYLRGRLAMLRGSLPEANAHLGRAWLAVDPEIRPALARAIGEQLACCHFSGGDVAVAAQWGRRALDLGPAPPGDPTHLLDVLILSLSDSGAADEAASLAAAVPAPDQDPARAPVTEGSVGGRAVGETWHLPPDGLVGRGIVRLAADDLPAAREAFLAAMAISDGQEWKVPSGLFALIQLAGTEFLLGLWDAAIAHAETAVALASSAGQGWLLPACHAAAACPLAARGNPKAVEHLENAVRLPSAAVPCLEAAVMKARLWTARALDDPEASIAALEGHRIADRREPPEPRWMLWRPLLAEALAQTGRPAEATDVLRPVETAVERRGRRTERLSCLRARAVIEVASGRGERADQTYRDALRLAAELPLPFERALLELQYGATLMRTARMSSPAGDLLEAARGRFAALGAEPYIAMCDRELASCGRLSPRHHCGALDALTPQEIRVARLAATGRSNAVVARELVLSVKTIEYHLGNVYAKLGLRSRRELAAALPAEVVEREG